MRELIEIGIRQGTVLGFLSSITEKSESYKALLPLIQNGRFGGSQNKGLSTKNLFVALTQDCTIANASKYVELAQLKRCNVKDESKVEHLLLGGDYSKLILKIEDHYYELEEVLVTKINKQHLYDAVRSSCIEIKCALPPRSKKILLDWRLLTYFREPFPDKFNKLLSSYLRDSDYWFTKFMLEHQEEIHSIRVYVTPEDDESADMYQFSLCALLAEAGENNQEKISSQIDKMLHEFSDYDGISSLQLADLDANSVELPEHLMLSLTSTLDEFSFASAYVMREFNFQYLCY